MRARRSREVLLVLAVALVATSVLTYPLVPKMDRVGRTNTGDGLFSIWNVAWVAHALSTDPASVYQANIFYPHRDALAFSEPNLVAGALAVPVWAATGNPYFAHNSVVFLAFVLSITGAYALARHLTGHPGAAVFAALAFAFCPFIYARTAHIQLLMTAGLPWSLWACHRLADAPSVARAVSLGVILALTGLACGYYGFFAGLSVGLALLYYAAARGSWRTWRYWALTTLAAVVTIGLTLPFLVPLIRLEGADFNRRAEDAAMWSANWQAYLASGTRAHAWMLPYLDGFSEVLFPGFLATILGVAGVVLAVTRRLRPAEVIPAPPTGDAHAAPAVAASRPGETIGFYAILGGTALWTSFGPAAGLYTLLWNTIPMFGFTRAPARLGIVVTLALVACAAVALAHLARGRRVGRVLLPAATVLLVAELTSVPLPLREVDPAPEPVYRTLARLPRGPVAEFPYFYMRNDFHRHTYYMVRSTAHWFPLINGYSDHIPQDFRDTVVLLSSFPSRDSFAILEQRQARYAVFHWNLYDSRNRAKAKARIDEYSDYLAPIYKDENVWLYAITGWPR